MGGMQRLQQVVPHRGQEAALGIVGALSLALGRLQQGGAFAHALFQRFVAALELALAAAKRGDIGEGGHKTAARHRVAADLDNLAIRKHPLGQMRRASAHEGQPPVHRTLVATARRHCLQCPAGQINNWAAHLQQFIGESKHARIWPVPRHQPLLAVDHADALAHVLQRRLQHLLTEAQILGGFADDGRHRRQLTSLASCRVQQQACGGRTQHR